MHGRHLTLEEREFLAIRLALGETKAVVARELGCHPGTVRRECQRNQVERAISEAAPMGGKVVWIMESTPGWARVKELIGQRVQFVLANVLQMPLPPKAYRRKSDKIDTGRILREFLNGSLPQSYQPAAWWREVRRLVDSRQDLVERQTAVKNWVTHFLHHETWYDREGLWTQKGMKRLRAFRLPASDRRVLDLKLQELEELAQRRGEMEGAMQRVYDPWPEAQWVDEVRGIGMVTAVSILAHIGPIDRFPSAEDLISYAGLAPGHRQSDQTAHNGRIGGGGTDSQLRYLLIESMQWVCQIPRYRPAFERAVAKHGTNIARITPARMLLRSLLKVLRDRVRFNQVRAARAPLPHQRQRQQPVFREKKEDGSRVMERIWPGEHRTTIWGC